jgi:hypothetical protein
MAYIPPGPQAPFSKDRSYGQEPGFVSRNSGKIFALLAVLALIGVAIVFFGSIRDSYDDDDEDQPTANIEINRHGGRNFEA